MRQAIAVLALGISSSFGALAATSNPLGAAGGNVYNRPDDQPLDTQSTPRVRIPLSFKAWSDVETMAPDGKMKKSRIAGKAISQVLRARIERSNDFFLGNFRVKTTPIRWLKRSNQYQVKLEVFKRLGEDGTLEENLGSVTLTGVLEKQDDGLFVLNGTARRLFRERTGEPILDFDAGQHAPIEKPMAISRM